MRYGYQQVMSKWKKYQTLRTNPSLFPHLPALEPYTPQALDSLLQEYGEVFLKPDYENHRGIYQVSVSPAHEEILLQISQYQCRRQFPLARGYYWLAQRLQNRPYLIQRVIPLSSVQKRPFDFRIILQRPQQKWEPTGLCARIARNEWVPANVCRGGQPVSLARIVGIRRQEQGPALEQILQRLGMTAAETLEHHFPGLRELGFDIGMDQMGKLWLFETYTRPSLRLFRSFAGGRMYEHMMRYRSYIMHRRLRGRTVAREANGLPLG